MAYFRDLQLKGPARGYFPEPTKSILVVSEKNVPRANAYFRGMGVKVVTGIRYLGGYIGEREAEAKWVQGNLEGWADSVRTLTGVTRCTNAHSCWSDFCSPAYADCGCLRATLERVLTEPAHPSTLSFTHCASVSLSPM